MRPLLSCVLLVLAVAIAPRALAQDAPEKLTVSAERRHIPSGLLEAAQRECCPPWFLGDRRRFDRCCMKYGFCPICKGASLVGGCWYRNAWHPIGAVIERNARKCYEVRCVWARPHPTIQIRSIYRDCGCCERYGRLYPPGSTITIDVCKRQRCVDGRWVRIPPLPNTYKPCPPGTITYNNQYCLFVWPIWVSWQYAVKYCSLLGGHIALPFTYRENELILNELSGSAGWLSKEHVREFKSDRWGNETSPFPDSAVLRRKIPSDQCLGIRLGSRRWTTWPCGWHAHPVCIIPRVPCEPNHCIVNGRKYAQGQTITRLGRCQRIICSNSYPRLIITSNCCYFQGWHPLIGWISKYYPYGSFSPYPGTKCFCRKDRTVTCCTGRFCLFSDRLHEFRLSFTSVPVPVPVPVLRDDLVTVQTAKVATASAHVVTPTRG